jgi:uncharacterized LabA/DUF88 family protein
VTNQGYDVVIIPSDVDVALALEAAEYMFSPHIDTIVIVSRDSDFKPVLTKAKEHGKDTIVVGTEPDFSSALKNSADLVIDLKAEGGLMDRREDRHDMHRQEIRHEVNKPEIKPDVKADQKVEIKPELKPEQKI